MCGHEEYSLSAPLSWVLNHARKFAYKLNDEPCTFATTNNIHSQYNELLLFGELVHFVNNSYQSLGTALIYAWQLQSKTIVTRDKFCNYMSTKTTMK